MKQGAGLLMLGGFHTFGPGGYQDTPLAELLPVTMDANERQRLGDPIRTDVQLTGPLKIRPAKPLGERHYLMALGDGRDRDALWDKLPPLEGANQAWAPRSRPRKCWPKRPKANRCSSCKKLAAG